MAKKRSNGVPRIDRFGWKPGEVLAGKYRVVSKLGDGWEGEVYKIAELATGIERAAKVFFPHRNKRNHNSKLFANKLHKLRDCPIVIHYHGQETVLVQGVKIPLLVSEFVEGELLTAFLRRQPGGRLTPYQGVHLLHALACGIEDIHKLGEYHGDLHTDNVIVQRFGLEFSLKLLDFYQWHDSKSANMKTDVVDIIRIFYDALGGAEAYSGHPRVVKEICCGLKRSLILRRFKRAAMLRQFLETMEWR